MNLSKYQNSTAIVIFGLGFLNIVYSLFIFEKLWNWFLYPLGFVMINFPEAVGIYLLLKIFDRDFFKAVILIDGFLTNSQIEQQADEFDKDLSFTPAAFSTVFLNLFQLSALYVMAYFFKQFI